jgi:putative ABC transport system ATP-binding protein
MSGLAIHVEQAAKRYRTGAEQVVVALDGVSLDLAPGSVTGITGPSGSGKSTLLHVIGAMDTLDSGTIRVGDREVSSLSRKQQIEYRRTIGFVFQRFHLLPALTVADNVAAPLLPRRQPFDVGARARELVAAVGLEGREDSLPSKLSGGQQQRVAVARALMNDPGLLLADEPTGNLDETQAERLMQLLKEMNRLGTTVLVATHNDGLVARHPARALLLEHGRLLGETGAAQAGARTPPRHPAAWPRERQDGALA